MKKKRNVASELVSRASSVLPKFTDVFDEETFYIFFAFLVVVSFLRIVLPEGGINRTKPAVFVIDEKIETDCSEWRPQVSHENPSR
ncbi:unnamed protein product [Dicrocoelium dendriticum]|nr:unnamed protein product [Dicrocoelium dendriticum]